MANFSRAGNMYTTIIRVHMIFKKIANKSCQSDRCETSIYQMISIRKCIIVKYMNDFY